MALPWFKVHADLTGHPKLSHLESLLGLSDGAGIIIRMWAWTSRYAPLGEVLAASIPALIDCVTRDGRVTSREGVIAALSLAGWVHSVADGLEIHDWKEEQGALVRITEQNRVRQRRHRAVTRDVTPMSREEKRREEKRASDLAKPETAPVVAMTPFLAYLAAEFPLADAGPKNEKAWRDAAPLVDLLAEAKKARRWELDNPKKVAKKSKRRFLGGWFDRAQESARKEVPSAPPAARASFTPTAEETAARFRAEDELRAKSKRTSPGEIPNLFARRAP